MYFYITEPQNINLYVLACVTFSNNNNNNIQLVRHLVVLACTSDQSGTCEIIINNSHV